MDHSYTCKICDKNFTTKRKSLTGCCSKTCREINLHGRGPQSIKHTCEHCKKQFDNFAVPTSKINTKHCKTCRNLRECKTCGEKFIHHQNQTCSPECAQKMKEASYFESCGATHNLARNSKSREEMVDRMFDEYGVTNVFQREDVKQTIQDTWKEKYGVDNPSKAQEIKDKKQKTAVENGHWIDYKKYPRSEREIYYIKVWETTTRELLEYGMLFYGDKYWEYVQDPNMVRDHRYAISKGFTNGIPPEKIGSIYNIEYMPEKQNLEKGTKCSITEDELNRLIDEDSYGIYK